jgi:hypothetical protein
MKKFLAYLLLAASLGLQASAVRAKPPKGGYPNALDSANWVNLKSSKTETAQQMSERLGVNIKELLDTAKGQYASFNFDYHISRFIPTASDRTLTNVRQAEKTAKESFNGDIKNLRDALTNVSKGANDLKEAIGKQKVDKTVTKQIDTIIEASNELNNKLNYRDIAGPDFTEALDRAERLAKLGKEKLKKYEGSLTSNMATLRKKTEKLNEQQAPRVMSIEQVKSDFQTLWSEDIRGMGTAIANVEEIKVAWSDRWNRLTNQSFATLPTEGVLDAILEKLDTVESELEALKGDIANIAD